MSNTPFETDVGGAERLTEAGQRRRDEILTGLHQQLRQRVVRRRIVRGACLAVVVVGASVGGVVALRHAGPTERSTPGGEIANVPAPKGTPDVSPKPLATPRFADAAIPGAEIVVQIISSDSLPPLNCADPASPATIRVCMLSDDQLIEELAAAGEPCGLVRAGGKTRLLCDDIGKGR